MWSPTHTAARCSGYQPSTVPCGPADKFDATTEQFRSAVCWRAGALSHSPAVPRAGALARRPAVPQAGAAGALAHWRAAPRSRGLVRWRAGARPAAPRDGAAGALARCPAKLTLSRGPAVPRAGVLARWGMSRGKNQLAEVLCGALGRGGTPHTEVWMWKVCIYMACMCMRIGRRDTCE